MCVFARYETLVPRLPCSHQSNMIPMSAYLPYMPKRMATIKIMTDISKHFAKSSDIKILTGLKGAGLFITLL